MKQLAQPYQVLILCLQNSPKKLWLVLPDEICLISSYPRGIAPSKAVRVKGELSLRNGMWHGLRNNIIMRNVKYGKWRKEIN